MQSIGTGVVNIAPGDCFELIARQTSGSTKNVVDDEFTWFALEPIFNSERPESRDFGR